MSELIVGVVLGAMAVGIAGLYVIARMVIKGIDGLRAEIAMARIEGVLGKPPNGTGGLPAIRRRKRHLGVVSAVTGVAVSAVAWVRAHHGTSVSVATAAIVVAGALYLTLDGSRHDAPAGPRPTSSTTASLLPPTPSSSSTSAAPTASGPTSTPSPSARPPAHDADRRPPTTAVALTRPPSPGLTPTPGPTTAPTARPTGSPEPTASGPVPPRPPGRDPHCLRLELLRLVDADTCLTL